ncbi:hypothetical protein K3N28_07065 [Glycomyces sp. TRM65418]|uniref:hypothetical protein n=1 Tax=Glycomyces sp. TRM65418 TaxID=2867006 RepID=UPI001CE6B4A0|nr:hypothetical protein [Glycomyces sp. TRM65418]MCC3762830.1 hypothetical protein [Glycomyces sp. TRM65418]QZD56857.1 hypothetical protein K3N28_07015 [Glycomyces sp. TRM65418]
MTTILDLPLHPLAVHLPIVLVGLLVLGGLAYLLVPPLRRFLGWAVAALVLVAPLAAWGTVWSGEQLANHLYPDGWSEGVQRHYDNGRALLWTLVALVPVWMFFAGLDRGRRAALRRGEGAPAPAAGEDGEAAPAADPAATGRKILMFIVGLVALALLGLAGWFLFQAGHTGAEMVWGGTVQQ